MSTTELVYSAAVISRLHVVQASNRGSIPDKDKKFLSVSKASTLVLDPTALAIWWVTRALSLGVIKPRRYDKQLGLPASSAEVKDRVDLQAYTFLPPSPRGVSEQLCLHMNNRELLSVRQATAKILVVAFVQAVRVKCAMHSHSSTQF